MDTDEPVPVANRWWSKHRLWTFHYGDPFGDSGNTRGALPSNYADGILPALRRYVLGVASIAELVSRGEDGYPYAVDEPLPDELPADITPELAEHLACWLEPSLERAHELLELLERRSREDPADFAD